MQNWDSESTSTTSHPRTSLNYARYTFFLFSKISTNSNTQQLYYVSTIFYSIVHPAAKISILLLYLRIFPNKKFQLFTKGFIVFMAIHTLLFFFVTTFQCLPVQSIWDVSIKGNCLNLNDIIYAGGALSIFEDLVVILLPIKQLMALSFSTKKRCALAFMFSLGSL